MIDPCDIIELQLIIQFSPMWTLGPIVAPGKTIVPFPIVANFETLALLDIKLGKLNFFSRNFSKMFFRLRLEIAPPTPI